MRAVRNASSYIFFLITARSSRALTKITGDNVAELRHYNCKVERDNRNKTTIKRTVGW